MYMQNNSLQKTPPVSQVSPLVEVAVLCGQCWDLETIEEEPQHLLLQEQQRHMVDGGAVVDHHYLRWTRVKFVYVQTHLRKTRQYNYMVSLM